MAFLACEPLCRRRSRSICACHLPTCPHPIVSDSTSRNDMTQKQTCKPKVDTQPVRRRCESSNVGRQQRTHAPQFASGSGAELPDPAQHHRLVICGLDEASMISHGACGSKARQTLAGSRRLSQTARPHCWHSSDASDSTNLLHPTRLDFKQGGAHCSLVSGIEVAGVYRAGWGLRHSFRLCNSHPSTHPS